MIAQAGFVQVQDLNRNVTGITAIGGGNGIGGVFRPGPKGKVALRVEGDLEVTGDMPRTVHVSKCEVAPAECRCIVYVPQAEPLVCPVQPFPWLGVGLAAFLALVLWLLDLRRSVGEG